MFFKMKKIICAAVILCAFTVKGQILITSKNSTVTKPDPSSVLHISDDKRGLLLPQVGLLNNTDQVTVPTPVNGVLVFNTNTNKTNFWANGKWNRNFDVNDGLAIIKRTENFTGSCTKSTIINSFPTSVPLFNLDDNINGWTDLNTTTTIKITKTSNSNYIMAEGMVQINNLNNTYQKFQFAIGIFVNGKLKLASKYTTSSSDFVCNWRKFNLSGVFNDLPIGTHTLAVYGKNLPTITNGYDQIVYGGNAKGCNNINDDMARIHVTAQTTQ